MKNTLLALLGLIFVSTPLAATAQQFGDFTYTSDGQYITITRYTGPGGAVTIPSVIAFRFVRFIGNNAFQNDTLVTSITIPNTVAGIATGAFYGCTSLIAITVDAANVAFSSLDGVLFNKSQTSLGTFPGGKTGNYTVPGSVTYIGYAAFYHCTSLTNIIIPDTVTSIADNAFNSCTSLANITIPGSVTSVGYQAFVNCTSLVGATLLDGVTSIGGGAFYGCSSLTSITIPGSITSIGYYAFFDCTNLTNVTIPGSVTNIGTYAFQFCTGLQGVFFMGNTPNDGSGLFSGDDNVIVYYLPGTTGWGSTFWGRPTSLWNPLMQSSGVGSAGFGFNITGTADIPIVVEAATSLTSGSWVPLQSLNLTNGAFYFSDPNWTNYPARFYRIRSP